MANKFVLVKIEGDYHEPKLIVASKTEAEAIKKIIDPCDQDYVIYEVCEL